MVQDVGGNVTDPPAQDTRGKVTNPTTCIRCMTGLLVLLGNTLKAIVLLVCVSPSSAFLSLLSSERTATKLYTRTTVSICGPRLTDICKFIDENSSVADIGCDHALLAVALSRTHPNTSYIGIDCAINALQQASRTVNTYGLTKVKSLRCGNGFRCLNPGEADTAVLAGIGKNVIFQILTLQPLTSGRILSADTIRMFTLNRLDELGIRKLILQPTPPHRSFQTTHFLRLFILSHGWTYEDEVICSGGAVPHYLTTCFVRGPGSSTRYTPVTMAEALERSPLHRRFMGGESSPEERELYRMFLVNHQAELAHKVLLHAMHRSPNDVSAERELVELLKSIPLDRSP